LIDNFENYLKLGKAKKKTPDLEEAKSLIQKSKLRIQYLRELNEKTTSLFFEDVYEAAREAAQALMSLEGFKPYSHEATISFLREYYKEQFTGFEVSQFDRFRELRGNSVYRAEEISKEDALKCLEFAKIIIKKVEIIIYKSSNH
jgi:uncharacterized protein (UPF0332 family)